MHFKRERENREKIKEIIVARTQTDKKIVNQSQAYSKLGKVIKPVEGAIVVRFNQKNSKRLQVMV